MQYVDLRAVCPTPEICTCLGSESLVILSAISLFRNKGCFYLDGKRVPLALATAGVYRRWYRLHLTRVRGVFCKPLCVGHIVRLPCMSCSHMHLAHHIAISPSPSVVHCIRLQTDKKRLCNQFNKSPKLNGTFWLCGHTFFPDRIISSLGLIGRSSTAP